MSDLPSVIGARAELEVANALTRSGRTVYLPFFAAHTRVDLVFEDAEGLHRVQCKTSISRGDHIEFRTCSNTKHVRIGYRGHADFFGVYSPELKKVYLVPVAVTAERSCSLRLSSPRNNQRARIHWAVDYEVRDSPDSRT